MSYFFRVTLLCLALAALAVSFDEFSGSLEIWGDSGVPAMHAAVLSNGKVAFLDKVEDRNKVFLPNNSAAYSCLYDPSTNNIKALSTVTNPFCCAGAFLADGRLVSLGGNGPLDLDPNIFDGFDAIRYLDAEGSQSGWDEPGNKLSTRRWYATAQVMPDGTVFVASGSLTGQNAYDPVNNNPTYEILDKNGVTQMPKGKSIPMDILVRNGAYYMYPHIYLLKDGNLFVFVNTQAQIFQPADNHIIKELPDLPGYHRTYPSTGGAAMLPLSKAIDFNPEIMICGGGMSDAFTSPTDSSCGRIRPLDSNPGWQLTHMPEGRVMVEAVNLLDGKILWINGAMQGAQGFGVADHPAYDTLIYNPTDDTWWSDATSTIARLYHSVAMLLPNGKVLVTGSNPNEQPRPWPASPGVEPKYLVPGDQQKKWPTEFRVEIYTPQYLQGDRERFRPTHIKLSAKSFKPGQTLTIRFKPAEPLHSVETILYAGGFVTHSLHMGQVMFYMENKGWWGMTDGTVVVEAKIPDVKMAPGPYWIYLMANGVPGMGQSVLVEL